MKFEDLDTFEEDNGNLLPQNMNIKNKSKKFSVQKPELEKIYGNES
jgi:hypothetical protein